jgi:hypothetical protein
MVAIDVRTCARSKRHRRVWFTIVAMLCVCTVLALIVTVVTGVLFVQKPDLSLYRLANKCKVLAFETNWICRANGVINAQTVMIGLLLSVDAFVDVAVRICVDKPKFTIQEEVVCAVRLFRMNGTVGIGTVEIMTDSYSSFINQIEQSNHVLLVVACVFFALAMLCATTAAAIAAIYLRIRSHYSIARELERCQALEVVLWECIANPSPDCPISMLGPLEMELIIRNLQHEERKSINHYM